MCAKESSSLSTHSCGSSDLKFFSGCLTLIHLIPSRLSNHEAKCYEDHPGHVVQADHGS